MMTHAISLRRRMRAAAFATACLCARMFADAAGAELAISGDRFVVDGQPRFLVFISYFDALRASAETLESDFRYLRANGFDGIRIFPNWWDMRAKNAFPSDTLMDANGMPRRERLRALENVLDRAARHGLLVDISFAYETVRGLSELRDEQVGRPQGELPVNRVHIDDYERGLVRIAQALRAHRHIFFDVQNEYNGRITHLTDDEVQRLCAAIKRADPGRIVAASLANEIGPEDVARRSDAVGADVVAWHESRNPWRYDAMDELVRRVANVSAKPVYLGEPAVMDDGMTAANFVTALTKAKAAGAAAWTFHTQHGFDLAQHSIENFLSAEEKRFVATFARDVRAATWGLAAPDAGGN